MSWPQNGRKYVLVLIVELRKIVVQVVNTICGKTSLITLMIYPPPPPPNQKKKKQKKKIFCVKNIFNFIFFFFF